MNFVPCAAPSPGPSREPLLDLSRESLIVKLIRCRPSETRLAGNIPRIQLLRWIKVLGQVTTRSRATRILLVVYLDGFVAGHPNASEDSRGDVTGVEGFVAMRLCDSKYTDKDHHVFPPRAWIALGIYGAYHIDKSDPILSASPRAPGGWICNSREAWTPAFDSPPPLPATSGPRTDPNGSSGARRTPTSCAYREGAWPCHLVVDLRSTAELHGSCDGAETGLPLVCRWRRRWKTDEEVGRGGRTPTRAPGRDRTS